MSGDTVIVSEFSLDEHADQVVLWLFPTGGHDRPDDVDDLLWVMSERRPNLERVLDGYPEATGDGEKRDCGAEVDVELSASIAANPSISSSTVSVIQFVTHQLPLAGRNDDCTRLR